MADVEMTDAAPKTKVAKAAAGDSDGKKRFEIKKVGWSSNETYGSSMADGKSSGTQSPFGRGILL